MPDPMPVDLNTVVREIQRHAERLIRVAIVFKGPLGASCGNCGGDIENEQCRTCRSHMQVVVGCNDDLSCEELYDQAQSAFPALPYAGIAIVRPRRKSGDSFYMIVQLDLPNS